MGSTLFLRTHTLPGRIKSCEVDGSHLSPTLEQGDNGCKKENKKHYGKALLKEFFVQEETISELCGTCTLYSKMWIAGSK